MQCIYILAEVGFLECGGRVDRVWLGVFGISNSGGIVKFFGKFVVAYGDRVEFEARRLSGEEVVWELR